jgi:hypothetical protein
MTFTVNAPRGAFHKKLYLLEIPARKAAYLDRLREIRDVFEVVINRGAADMKALREFFDSEVSLHCHHPLPVDGRLKNTRQQPRHRKKRHGARKVLDL